MKHMLLSIVRAFVSFEGCFPSDGDSATESQPDAALGSLANVRLNDEIPENAKLIHEDHAFTSPIWYTPGK